MLLPFNLPWLYLLGATVLITHEIDSAYWHEWKLFGIPGGIQAFVDLNLVLVILILYGHQALPRLSLVPQRPSTDLRVKTAEVERSGLREGSSGPRELLAVTRRPIYLQPRQRAQPMLFRKRKEPSLMNTSIDSQAVDTAARRKVKIDFLYLDLNVCGRCKGTNANLEAAVSEVSQILGAAGVEVSVTKTQVRSEEQARALRFMSSPTIRVNDHDIALELRESHCQSCTGACNSAINCRVWVFQGREYTEAPKAMIVDAILREVYADQPRAVSSAAAFEGVPENLRRFFAGKSGSGCGVP